VEWLNDRLYPIVDSFISLGHDLADVLHTIVLHEATQIAAILNQNRIKTVLVTGGGTYNSFLIESINAQTNTEIIIPTDEIVEFKEALIFAFLGLLNVRDEVNTFKSVTGATHDSTGGFITYP
jgi:anhydro-N-acetylmuramic acid kinase